MESIESQLSGEPVDEQVSPDKEVTDDDRGMLENLTDPNEIRDDNHADQEMKEASTSCLGADNGPNSVLYDVTVETLPGDVDEEELGADKAAHGATEDFHDDATTENTNPSQQSDEKLQLTCEDPAVRYESTAIQIMTGADEETQPLITTNPSLKTETESSSTAATLHTEHAVKNENSAIEEETVGSPDHLIEGGSSLTANELLAISEDEPPSAMAVSEEILAKDVPRSEQEGAEYVGIISGHISSANTSDIDKNQAEEAPSTAGARSKGTEKLKFQVVNSGGKLTFKVTGDNTEKPAQRQESSSTSSDTRQPKVKRTRPKAKGKPQRSKSSDQPSIGSRNPKNKLVMSPVTPNQGQHQPAPQKPLMDLRHILKKREKISEAVQPVQQVDFYGSMSAIPFLKKKKPEDKKTKKTKPQPPESTNDKKEKAGSKAKQEQVVPPPVEKQRLPTKEEIIVTADYDEAQLEMWKSMSALDCHLDSVQRPQEMLPLRPGIRPKKKKEPSRNSVRAYSRPEDWINRPELSSPTRGYRVSVSQQPTEEADTLLMEPADSLNEQPPALPLDQ